MFEISYAPVRSTESFIPGSVMWGINATKKSSMTKGTFKTIIRTIHLTKNRYEEASFLTQLNVTYPENKMMK